MASSGTSSGSGRLQNSGSEGVLVDQRKRKRMISNRESARRSRMKKQKHMDELLAQASQLVDENNHVLTNVNLTTELFLKVDSENSVLLAQVSELTHRLKSLNDIINCMSVAGPAHINMVNEPVINDPVFDEDDLMMTMMLNGSDGLLNPWDWMQVNQNQPMMGSSDLMMYT